MNELVSIIVTSYNIGEDLRDAVSSIERQTYKSIEVIIVDDGSTDMTTLTILEELENKDYKIIYLTNSGVSVARNIGIQEAKGDYIIFLDGDDVLDDKYVMKVMTAQAAHPEVLMVYTLTQLIGTKNYIRPLNSPIYKKLLVYNDFFLVTCLLHKKRLQEITGFNETMNYGLEDWEMFIRYCYEGMTVCRINEPLFQYRIKPISRTIDVNTSRMKTLTMKLKIVSNNMEAYVTYPDSLKNYSLLADRNRSIKRIIEKLYFLGKLYYAKWLKKHTYSIFKL